MDRVFTGWTGFLQDGQGFYRMDRVFTGFTGFYRIYRISTCPSCKILLIL